MDYTPTTWVDDDGSGTVGTVGTASRMNNMEAGIADAVRNNRVGLLSARPAASAANKNWFWLATDGGLAVSDGSAWNELTLGGLTWPLAPAWRYVMLSNVSALLWNSNGAAVTFRSNYDPVNNVLHDPAVPSWQFQLNGATDQFSIQRAPATAGAPVYVELFKVASTGQLTFVKPPRLGQFGNGADGALTISAGAAPGVPPAGMTRSGDVYTLTRDQYFTDLTLNTGVTLVSAGFRVFCKGTLSGGGKIVANGGNAAAQVAGSAPGTGSVRGGVGGGTGGAIGGNGSAPGTPGWSLGHGGAGGAGGASSPRTAGSGTTPSTPIGGVRRALPELATGLLYDLSSGAPDVLGGGGGGGGGAGSTTAVGGGGGAGGGLLIVAAAFLVGAISFEAKGGDGAQGGLNAGGGGGGGGGAIHILYGDNTAWAGTAAATNVAGGAAGAANGTGVAGTAGSAGNVVALPT